MSVNDLMAAAAAEVQAHPLTKNGSVDRPYQEAMKYNISISPGQIFSSQGCYGNCMRIGYGRKYDAEVEYCFKVLGELIKKMMRAK